MRTLLKRSVQSIFLVLMFPAALLSGFGTVHRMYLLFAHVCAILPGVVGDFCRTAYYRMTLKECSPDTSISFGSFFSVADACVGSHVSIGAFCVIGSAVIGKNTQIASHVQIPSGRHQHSRDEQGRLTSTAHASVVVGPDCWIGSSAVVLASVGAGTTVGAGAVVVKELPEGVVAVGNPAQVIKTATRVTAL